jgi:hypothetical protein
MSDFPEIAGLHLRVNRGDPRWLADREIGQRLREMEALARLRRAARKARRRRLIDKWFWPFWAFSATLAAILWITHD